jgi:hypothetical protein
MKISEACSCGATFKVEGAEAVRLVRDWRRNHKHESSAPDTEATFATTGDARIENAIGFQVDGLTLPARQTPGWEDE